jgi:hypothetical protein
VDAGTSVIKRAQVPTWNSGCSAQHWLGYGVSVSIKKTGNHDYDSTRYGPSAVAYVRIPSFGCFGAEAALQL